MKKQIVQQMSVDLKIKRYPNEKIEDFYSRLLYSAISCWLRYVILDKSNNDADKERKSKKYVLARGIDILENYLALFPECFKYFCVKDEEEVSVDEAIKCIRERMLNGGELLEINPNKYITLPTPLQKVVYNSILRKFGLTNNDFTSTCVGIARIEKNKEIHIYENGLNIENSIHFFDWLIKNAKWERFEHPENLKVFNSHSKNIPTFSWGEYQTNLLKDDYFLAKSDNPILYGEPQYYILKKDNYDKFFISKIDSILIDWLEYRRIILALRKKADNQMKAQVRDMGNCKILKLFGGLPLREQIIFETYCWPKENIYNRREYVVSNDIWDYIKTILETLCIAVEEVL